MAFNLADLIEHCVDAVPDRTAIVVDDQRRTYRELEERANQIAHHLGSQGVGAGDHVGIYGYNSVPWVEAMLAAYKLRAVAINVNYRYVEEELAYIFDNADLKAVVHDREFAPRIANIRDRVPTLETLLSIEDGSGADIDAIGSVDLDKAAASQSTERDFGERSPDDLYILYTGGTTGFPKGVMWRQEDIYFALMGGIDPATDHKVTDEHEPARVAAESDAGLTFFTMAPLMHGAAQAMTTSTVMRGNTMVMNRVFDPARVWETIEREKVNVLMIVGDAMGRPLIEYLDQAGRDFDLSSLFSLSSTAAIFSPTVKDMWIERFPNLIITDSVGASEVGYGGTRPVGKGDTQMRGGGPSVVPGRQMRLINEETVEEIPSSDTETIGKIASVGHIPVGYYKDEKKTAETFVTAADGQRYSVPGDFGKWEDDGTITLLGRGSVCINTGGEKVYPEEVEQALKAHDSVFDCIVVGVADDRWGQKVVAVVQPRPGHQPDLDTLVEHCRTHIAGYKIPRGLVEVDQIVRSPSGKPDYPWAKKFAEETLGI